MHWLTKYTNKECHHSNMHSIIKEISRVIKGLFTLNPDSNWFSNWITQCEFSAHWLRPHCIVRNRIHACTLTSSGHTSTQLSWRPRQIFTSASHHIASQVEQIRGTQCVAWRSVLTVGSRHEHACMPCPFWSLRATRNCAIQFNPDQNHLWKWIGINPDRIQFGQMCIQCERAQTGLNSNSMRVGCPVWTGLNIQSPLKIGCNHGLTNTSELVAVTANCSLISMHKILGTAWEPQELFEACLKNHEWPDNHQTDASIMKYKCKWSSCSTLVLQAFTILSQ